MGRTFAQATANAAPPDDLHELLPASFARIKPSGVRWAWRRGPEIWRHFPLAGGLASARAECCDCGQVFVDRNPYHIRCPKCRGRYEPTRLMFGLLFGVIYWLIAYGTAVLDREHFGSYFARHIGRLVLHLGPWLVILVILVSYGCVCVLHNLALALFPRAKERQDP